MDMDLSNKKILISDDSILARKQLKDIINSIGEGAEFIDAANGQEAIDKYKENTPDITFLDIVMPVKDGIEAVKGIMEINKDAQIIIVSSVGTQSQLKAALEAGAKDFIQKPIEASHVETLLQTHLG